MLLRLLMSLLPCDMFGALRESHKWYSEGDLDNLIYRLKAVASMSWMNEWMFWHTLPTLLRYSGNKLDGCSGQP